MAYRQFALSCAALAASLALFSAAGAAKPLDTEICQRIKTDIQGLEQQGVRELLAKGAQTAKSLQAAQLEKIRTLMDLDGQARFRCGERSFVTLKEEPPEVPDDPAAAPATIDGSTPGITLPPGAQSIGPVVPPVKRRPPPPAKAKAPPATPAKAAAPAPAPAKAAASQPPVTPAKTKAAKPAAPDVPADAAATAPAAKPKAPTPPTKKAEKPKSDDAYRPPAPVKTE